MWVPGRGSFFSCLVMEPSRGAPSSSALSFGADLRVRPFFGRKAQVRRAHHGGAALLASRDDARILADLPAVEAIDECGVGNEPEKSRDVPIRIGTHAALPPEQKSR
jgi:hypothetical protein